MRLSLIIPIGIGSVLIKCLIRNFEWLLLLILFIIPYWSLSQSNQDMTAIGLFATSDWPMKIARIATTYHRNDQWQYRHKYFTQLRYQWRSIWDGQNEMVWILWNEVKENWSKNIWGKNSIFTVLDLLPGKEEISGCVIGVCITGVCVCVCIMGVNIAHNCSCTPTSGDVLERDHSRCRGEGEWPCRRQWIHTATGVMWIRGWYVYPCRHWRLYSYGTTRTLITAVSGIWYVLFGCILRLRTQHQYVSTDASRITLNRPMATPRIVDTDA